VDKEVAETRATLAKEEATPLSDETTDQNPTYAWINGELAKAKADLSGLQARETATQAIVNLYSANARQLDEKGITQQDLLRTQKANEANYLLYLKKGEEARIADALDQNNILNVAVAQPPSVPALPTRSPWLFVMLGLILAPVVSMGLALTLDYLDQSFRTPTEVTAELGIPVLAAVPRRAYSDSMNGNGHRNGNGNGKSRSLDEDADIRPAHLA
jgi:protein tyrosine kinase modulator